MTGRELVPLRELEERSAAVATLATVSYLPGVGGAAGYRAATFEEYLLSIGLSNKTINCYRLTLIRATVAAARMGVDIRMASALILAEIADGFPNSHAGRHHLRSTLRHFYEWLDRNDAPLRAVRVPPQQAMVCRAVELDQAAALVRVARGWWPQGAVIILGLYMALRREEMAKAEWLRFDAEMEWYTVQGKFSKTARIPVNPIVREELGPHRGPGFLFPGKRGRDHVTPATIWNWTREVAKAAGLTEFTTHQLRHTSLATALDNTDNLRSVMAFARHSKPEVTAGYTRTSNIQLRAVSDALRF